MLYSIPIPEISQTHLERAQRPRLNVYGVQKSSFYFLIIFNKTGTYKMYILATNENNETKKFNNFDINNALDFAGKNGKLKRFYK